MRWIKNKNGFTLLELIVSIAASSVIIGGFLIAFSSVERSARAIDMESKNVARGNNVRLLIHKLLAGASSLQFATVNSGGEDYNVLYYYRWEKDATGVERLIEYGYFFTDEPLSNEAGYEMVLNAATGAYDRLPTNLYFNRVIGDNLTPVPATDFNFQDPNRFAVMEGVSNFYAKVGFHNTNEGASDISEKVQNYTIDYQITSEYDTGQALADGSDTERRQTIFKGNAFAMGRVTEG